jgi:hypothetical protein
LAFLLSVSLGAQSRSRAQEQDDRENSTQRFSLAQALRLMRSSHPALRSQEESIAAVEGDVDASSLWTNPQFEGGYLKGVRKSSYDPFGYAYYGITQFLELSNVPGTRRRMGNSSSRHRARSR